MNRTVSQVECATADAASFSIAAWWRLQMELAKARLSTLVVATAAVGYLVAARGNIDLLTLLCVMLGTALSAWCANALNQVIEVERDRKMPRTAGRPLPTQRITRMHAAMMATLAGGVGVTLLAATTNLLTAGLSLLTIFLYLCVYTPLKTRSTLNTIVGAVVGAIPPMMGWVAATGRIDAGAWILAAVLFVWQIPHFLALALMFRKDYEQGGYRMLPMFDPTWDTTGRAILVWTVCLIPVTLAAVWAEMTGLFYAAIAIGLGLWMLKLALELYRDRTQQSARKLFMATVSYLPLLLLVMVLDRPLWQTEAVAEPVNGSTVSQPIRTITHQTLPGN